MIIIPAVDIKNGACVRLFQGDFDQQTTYSKNPLKVALTWQKMGTPILHVVDLDGAKNGSPINFELITKLAKQMPIEVGGGIRTIETIEKYLSVGVVRVVLGTILLENADLAKEIFEKFGEKIVVGLDAKNNQLMTNGWITKSKQTVLETAQTLQSIGAKRIIYTDILKDGSLTEPNFKMLETLVKNLAVPIIASGGISNLAQIKKLQKVGIEGVIIGKALYEKKIDVKEALSIC